MKKPLVIFVSILLMTSILFSGCQVLDLVDNVFQPDEPIPLDAEITAPKIETQSDPTITPPPPSFYDLILWLPPEFDPQQDTASGRLLSEHIQNFLQENPAVNLTIRIKAPEGTTGLLNSLESVAEVAPDSTPSILLLRLHDLVAAAEKELIYPLDGLTTLLNEPDWYSFAREMGFFNGSIYGIPAASNLLTLILRDPTLIPASATWQSLFTSLNSIVFPAGDPRALVPFSMYISAGGTLADPVTRQTLDPEILENVLSIINSGVFTGTYTPILGELTSDDQSWNYFAAGNQEGVISWINRYLIDSATYSIRPLPSAGEIEHTFASGWLWCLSDPKEINHGYSVKLMEHLVDANFLLEWSQTSGYAPVRPSSMENWLEVPGHAVIQQMLESAEKIPDHSKFHDIGNIVSSTVVAVLNRQSSPAEAALGAFEEMDGLDFE